MEIIFHFVKTDIIHDGSADTINDGKWQVIGENPKDELLLVIDKIIFKFFKSPIEYLCVCFKLEI